MTIVGPSREMQAAAQALEIETKTLLADGQFDEAIDRASRIGINGIRDCAWRCIAYELVRAEKREKAIPVAKLIGDATIQKVALGVISSSYVEAKNLKEAVSIANENQQGKDYILKCIVESLAQCEDEKLKEAEDIAGTILALIEHDFAFRAIAIAYHNRGKYAEAQAMANRILLESIKPSFLRLLPL